MSSIQRTPQRKRRQQPVPTLRIEVRPLLVDGRQRKRRQRQIAAPLAGGRQRRRRPHHLVSWLAAFALVALALITTGVAYALSGHPGGIRHTSDLADVSGAPVPTIAAHAKAEPAARPRHALAATHIAATHSPRHTAATRSVAASKADQPHRVVTDQVKAASSTHTVSKQHTTTSAHKVSKQSKASTTHTAAKQATSHSEPKKATTHTAGKQAATHTAAKHAPSHNVVKTGQAATKSLVPYVPQVPVTSTPDASSTTSTQTDVAPLSTDLSTSEMASAAAAETQSFTPPAYLVSDYRALAKRYGLTWQVLAALSYSQEHGYGEALAGEQASQVTSAARDSLAEHGANVNVVAQAAAAAASPNATLVQDASKLAAAGGAASPAAALQTVTGSAATAQEVLTIAGGINSLATQSDTELADAAGGPTAKPASSSSKAYADVPTSAVTSTTAPTGQAAVELSAMLTEAHLLNQMPYVWGGGHTETAWLVDSGYDCSGFVSMVLHAAGYLSGPDTTQTLPDSAGILSGPGRYVTIYDRTVNTMNFAKPKATKASTAALALKQETQGVHMTGKSSKHAVSIRVSPAVQRAIHAAAVAKGNEADNTINDEHVVIDLDGQWWESGGDSQDGGAEMVHRITDIGQSYLKSFNLVLHPAGL